MFILDSLLIKGITFALDKVRQVAEQELDSPAGLQQRLLEAQLELEEGTLSEAEYARFESDIFERLRALRNSDQGGGIANASAFESIELELDDEPRR